MENCKYCNLAQRAESDPTFICQNDGWIAQLANDQSYLGRSIIASKNHIDSFFNITEEELRDFKEIGRGIEFAIRDSFGAANFNWDLLMNHAYLESPPNPHVHWHMRPRYDRPIEFGGLEFTDPEFGRPYDEKRNRQVSPETHRKIIETVKLHLPQTATQTF